MTKRKRIESNMRSFCCDTLADLYSGESVQGVLNDYEATCARRSGVYAMRNVIFAESLDLVVITFQTKAAKKEFFRSVLNTYNFDF